MFAHFSRWLRRVSPRRYAYSLALAQAVIFLLDTSTGAAISYAPFYSLPVALAAWRLTPAAVAGFVLSATLARVYDYSNAHADGGLLLAYDLLQSAAFYALVALLVWQMRHAFERVARRAHSLRRKARAERHRRVLDSTIRRAVPDDVAAIVRLSVLGGEDGAFDQNVNQQARQAGLASAFRRGIVTGRTMRDLWSGGQTEVVSEFWVSELDGQVVAFMMVLGMDGNQGPERELHALAIDPAFRGHGLGTLLVNFFCARYQHRRLLAACKYNSRMFQMLQRRHFKFHASSDQYEILVLG